MQLAKNQRHAFVQTGVYATFAPIIFTALITMALRLPPQHRLCYVSRNYNTLNMARINTEDLLHAWGAVNLGSPQTRHKNKVWGFLHNLWGMVRYTWRVRKGDIVVLQYPIKKYYKYICRTARRRGALTITLIHDLGCMKRRRITEQEELCRLGMTDYIIATNSVMRDWCLQRGLAAAQGALELWDYPSATPLRRQQHDATHDETTTLPIVVYAARIDTRRNAFLTQLEQADLPYQLHYYGREVGTPFGHNNAHIHGHDLLPSDTFIKTVEADYGLVWYGHALDSLQGPWGEYTQLCTPMKISFYLRSGIPVIIHRSAALAPLIEREGVGLAIDDLATLGGTLQRITPQQRQTMLDNVARMQQRIDSGYYLRHAIDTALASLLTAYQPTTH